MDNATSGSTLIDFGAKKKQKQKNEEQKRLDRAAGSDPEYLTFAVAEELGDIAGINIDDNCSIGEMAHLLDEIERKFFGDMACALAALRAGYLKFEEVRHRNAANEWWEWHIKAAQQ